MDIHTKLSILDRVYQLYNELVADSDMACRIKCADCCTVNVTITGLEGIKIVDYIKENKKEYLFAALSKNANRKRFQPEHTLNSIAKLFMEGKELPDETADPAWGTCPLLVNDECPVYKVRPFGCRCLVSKARCQENGFASMDPFTITINNVFMQYIEHLDQGGASGSLTDILIFLENEERQDSFENSCLDVSDSLAANQPITFLLVPPEHEEKIKPILESLGKTWGF